MKNRFGVARCCCTSFCEDCCNGNAPTEWDVDLQYADDWCTACNEDASGIFTLARSGGICRWRFIREKATGWSPDCVADYATYGNEFTRQEITLDVRCISETEYRVRATTALRSFYASGIEYNTQLGAPPTNWPAGEPITVKNFFRTVDAAYETTINFTDFICDEQVEFELPLASAFLSWSLEFLYPYPIFGPQWVFSTGGAAFSPLPVGPYLNWGLRAYGDTSPQAYIDIDAPCQPPASLLITSVP